MTGNQTDLAGRLRQAIESGTFRYGDDEPTPARPIPAETVPAEVAPTAVAPAETAPDETVPDETAPDETVPDEPVADGTGAVEESTASPADDVEPAGDAADEPADPDDADGNDDRATGLRAGLATGWHALVTWRLLPVTLLVITVLLTGLGAVMLIRAHADRVSGPMANQALVSAGDTQQVAGQVSTALNQILSYDMANPKPAQDAAKHWLVGDAPAQYRTLVDALGKIAADQKLTMVAKVSTAAVESLHDGTAQLLVFLDQQSTRASDHSSSVSAAQVRITAVRTSGGWRISEIVPL